LFKTKENPSRQAKAKGIIKMSEKRVEAVINTENIKKNYRYIKSIAAGSKVIAVVKAEAYGHGAVKVSRVLEEEGCDMFAVATVDEGEELKNAGIKGDILILGVTPAVRAEEIAKYGLIQSVNSAEYAESLSQSGFNIRVHIKADTGMSRLGLYCHSTSDAVKAADGVEYIHSLKGLKCEGIFTHFACSEDIPSEMTEQQYGAFVSLCDECEKRGINPGMRHCANSGAIINYPSKHLDAVRAGIILYGLMPDGSRNENLHPAMKLVSRVAQITHLKKGDTVSYGAAYTAVIDMDIAAISIGYADGFMRLLSGRASVVINGKRTKIIGKICMDMCMADVTGIGCKPGDEVEIFGGDISVDEQAAEIGTISYELLCAVSGRVPRRYI
jgi:alanine racemase